MSQLRVIPLERDLAFVVRRGRHEGDGLGRFWEVILVECLKSLVLYWRFLLSLMGCP